MVVLVDYYIVLIQIWSQSILTGFGFGGSGGDGSGFDSRSWSITIFGRVPFSGSTSSLFSIVGVDKFVSSFPSSFISLGSNKTVLLEFFFDDPQISLPRKTMGISLVSLMESLLMV